MDVDKFGSPPFYQIFPSIVRMLCAIIRSPSGNSSDHSEGSVVKPSKKKFKIFFLKKVFFTRFCYILLGFATFY